MTDKEYLIGLMVFIFGSSGLAENITSGRGSFLASVIVFAIGFGLMLDSYVKK